MAHLSSSCSNAQELSTKVIASRFCQNRRPIGECLNVDALEPHMRERFMLTIVDRSYLHSNETHKRVDYILDLIEERSLYVKFLESVKSETTHLGHGYVKALLEGTYYCSDDDHHKAAKLRLKVESQMARMMDIDLPSLVPLLSSELLLTKDERTLVTAKSEVQNQNALQFFDILETKGPLAYLKFVHCLSQEKSHPVHNELYKLLCQSTDEESAQAIVQGPTKRNPNRMVMEGALARNKYKRLFSKIKEHMYSGNWVAVKQKVNVCMQSEIPEVRVAGLIEDAVSWVFRCDDTKALTIINYAKELCETELSGSNAVYLKARAEYNLSGMYRYVKQDDKAVKCAEKAMVLLFNAAPGEDSAYANYNHACALAANSTPSDATQIMDEFTYAVDTGLADQAAFCRANRWSEVVANKSMIRQVMLLLDSNKNVPGTTDKTRKENITRASSSLSTINVLSLSDRMKCLYYLAESELHAQRQDVESAIKIATKAQKLAAKCEFGRLLYSANVKLHSLSLNCSNVQTWSMEFKIEVNGRYLLSVLLCIIICCLLVYCCVLCDVSMNFFIY